MAKMKLKNRLGSLLRLDLRGSQENVVSARASRPSGISVYVVRGRIEKEDVDVLVNSMSVSMNLHHGVLTTAISSRAGPALQEAVDEFGGPPHYGDVFQTAGYRLKARAVYHVVLCGFNYPNAGDVLEGLVLRCLELAEKDRRTSISIPALGTGRHAFPPFVVAHRMLEAVRRYEEHAGPKPTVRKIRFVLTEGRCISAFQTTLGEVPNASQKAVVEKIKQFRKSTMLSTHATSPSEYQALDLTSVEDDTIMDGSAAAAPPPPPPAKIKRPNKLQTKLVKALGVHKKFQKEQLISQLRSLYRELPQPEAFVPWQFVVTSRDHTLRSNDLDMLVDRMVSCEVHKKRNLILVHGLTYAGKSSLVNRIARLWADGSLRHVRLVIVVNLGVLLTNAKTPTLRECLLQCFSAANIDTTGGYQLFEFSSGKMLLLIDDAEAWCEHFRDELRLDPLFAKAHVIVTSRTSSSVRLADAFHPKLTVELCGFGPDLMAKYLQMRSPSSSEEHLSNIMPCLMDTGGSPSVIQTPGWLEHIYQVGRSQGSSQEVLQRQIWLLNTYIEKTADCDWLKMFQNHHLSVGEAFLSYLISKKDPTWSKFEDLELLSVGLSPRALIDYCMAWYIIDQIRHSGQLPNVLNSMEHVYLVQTSLEMACGHSQHTAHVISRFIRMLADDDMDVKQARERALDDNDSQSARTLKRVNDLQVACLRQSSTPHFNESDVPEELQYLGTEYSRVYLMACKQGTKSVRRTRVMLVGHFGAGKTSLKRRLINESFQAEYHITNGIDADPSNCTLRVDNTCNWSHMEEALRDVGEEHNREVARLVYSFIKKLKRAELPVSEEAEVSTPDYDLQDIDIDFESFAHSDSDLDEIDGPALGARCTLLPGNEHEYHRSISSSSSNGSNHRRTMRSCSMNKLVEAMGEAGLSEKEVDSLPQSVLLELKRLIVSDTDSLTRSSLREVNFTFWDFAGQNVFYTTHQTFLSRRAIYILVLDLTRPLDTAIETLRLSRLGRVIDRACPQTVGEYLDYWLNSIHTHAVTGETQQTELTQPPVIIVCTHKDVLDKEHGKEKADQMVKNYFRSIQRHLEKKAFVNHVFPKYFAVSNSVDGDPTLDRIREALVKVAEQQPYWGENIPLKWLELRTKLRDLQIASGSVTSMTKIMELARKVDISREQEVITFLLFYHALGELVFFDGEPLRDFVILDPQWLIENFRAVITIPKFHQQRVFVNSRAHWANLDDYGVLNRVILENVWDEKNINQLTNIMQKFNLILPINNDYQPEEDFVVPDLGENTKLYLVPCMLPQITPEDIPPPTEADPSPVLFVFKEGFVPLGLFHRLLATCINRLEWQSFGTVYHDFASFLPDEDVSICISLQVKDAHIEVTARSLDLEEEEGQGDMASSIARRGELLPATLKTLKHQLELHIETVSPTQQVFLGAKCTCKKGASAQSVIINLDKNIKKITDKKNLLCSKHKASFNSQSVQPWFIKQTITPTVQSPVGASPQPECEIPSDKQLLSLAEKLGYDWEQLAICLNLTSAQIEQCRMDHPRAVMQIHNMLVKWRHAARDKRSSRRLDELMQSLLDMKRADLAEKVACWKLEGKDLYLDWGGD